MVDFVSATMRRRPILFTSFAFTFIALVAGTLIIGFTAEAANYNAFLSGAQNWTAAVWGCSTTGPTDSCGAYPGALPNPGGDNANVTTSGGPDTLTVNTNIPNPVTLVESGAGMNVTVTSGGTLRLQGSSSVQSFGTTNSLSVNGGTLINTGVLDVTTTSSTGPPTLNLGFGGTISGPGTINVGSFGTTSGIMNITTTSGAVTIDQQTINDNGTVNLPGPGTLTMQNGATMNVLSPGVFANFNAGGGAVIANGGGAAPFFFNGGNVNVTGGAFTVNVPFGSAGNVSMPNSASTFNVLGGSTISQGTWNMLAGAINFGGANTFDGNASFTGTGNITINGGGSWLLAASGPMGVPNGINLTNNGSIDATGTTSYQNLNVGGNYTQGPAGSVKLKIGPYGPTTGQSDTFDVVGSSNLNGNFTAVLYPGYTPAGGDNFIPFATGTRVGDFASKTLPNSGGITFNASYTGGSPDQLQLIAAPSVDISLLKTGPATIPHNGTASYTVKVGNGGPANATNVSIVDTFSTGTFNSASPGCTFTAPNTVTCTIASLAAGTSVNFVVNLDAPTLGTISNTATLGSVSESDTNSANDTSSVNTTVLPVADFSVTKTGPATVAAGAPLSYTVSVNNAGPDAANATVTDNLPAGVGAVTTTAAGWNCSLAGSVVTCTTLSPIPTGAAPPIVLNMTAPLAGGNITNSVNVSSPSDSNVANNNASVTTNVTATADISMTKAVSGGGPFTAGQNITYTLTVTNIGPSNVTNVTVDDTPGAGLTFVSASAPCAAGFPCTIPTLNSGTSATITATFAISAGATGTVSNTATASSAATDPNNGNNASTTTTPLGVSADVKIQKTGPASASPGTPITYTIQVFNLGPSTATGVTVTDPTPAQTTLTAVAGAGCSAFPCTVGTLAPGGSAAISATYMVNAGATGSISNTATVSSASPDPVPTNNSSTAVTTIAAQADVQIVKVGPSSLPPGGGSITFNITVKNNGPGIATNLFINDSPSAGLNFASNSGACTTPFPCSIATLAAGASATIQSTFTVAAGISRVSNTADVTTSSSDPTPGNNSSTVIVGQACPNGTITQFTPAPGASNAPTSGPLSFSSVGATSYDIYLGPAGSGCSTLVATVNGTTYNYSGLTPNTDYESRIVARKASCSAITSQCVRWHTGTAGGSCNLSSPQLQQPSSGTTIASPTTLRWSAVAGADVYHVVVIAGGQTIVDTTTHDTFLDVTIPNGTVQWTVTAVSGDCSSTPASGQFNVCSPPDAPLAGVVGAPSSGNTYNVLVVNPSVNNVRYEFQEATNDAFSDATTQTTSSPSVPYTHTATTPQVFFYRVRAFAACTTTPGPYSRTVRVVIVPAKVDSRNPNFNIPFGTRGLIVVQVQIPGESTPVNFSATSDRPWIVRIDPSSGILPTAGLAVNLTIDPSQLPNGTFTATLIVTTSPIPTSNSRITTNGNGKSVPVTVNLVTPVVPNIPSGPTENSLIIPAVGHLAGVNSQWRSDIRIYNASPQALQYLLNFKPQGSDEVKQTTITTASGDTTALDDIIHNWYGVGEVGDSSTGVLEIRPMTTDGSTTPPKGSSFLTIASSRTFNATSDGTVGQFIPPVKFSNFIAAGSRLSLQQIAQSNAYRTNFGIVEASGSPANLLLSMFNDAGSKLFDLPLTLNGGEQKLLNGLLQQQGVSVNDGRMEVKVLSGDGKVTAYASVIDNASLDPQLVPGQNLTNTSSKLYVVPGVADLNNGVASWRTDMRIYNSGATPQTTELVFYPQDKAGPPTFATLTVNPNEVKALDNVLQNLFSTHDVGGMVQLTTANDSSLVVTGRTYNQTAAGTLGQFIKASTAADGATVNGKTLNILQVEDSPRFRTNVGVAEMTGQPATVEISLILPDSKVTPSIQVPLAANEFRQFGVAQFGVGNVYNARLSVKVIDGNGSVTSYGSVIDQVTTDPTFVQAQ